MLMAGLNHSRPMLLECEAEVGNIYRKSVLVTVLVGHKNSLGRKRKKDVRKVVKLVFLFKETVKSVPLWKHWMQHFSGAGRFNVSFEIFIIYFFSFLNEFFLANLWLPV